MVDIIRAIKNILDVHGAWVFGGTLAAGLIAHKSRKQKSLDAEWDYVQCIGCGRGGYSDEMRSTQDSSGKDHYSCARCSRPDVFKRAEGTNPCQHCEGAAGFPREFYYQSDRIEMVPCGTCLTQGRCPGCMETYTGLSRDNTPEDVFFGPGCDRCGYSESDAREARKTARRWVELVDNPGAAKFMAEGDLPMDEDPYYSVKNHECPRCKSMVTESDSCGDQCAQCWACGCDCDAILATKIITEDDHDYEVDDYILIVDGSIREVSGNSEMDYLESNSDWDQYQIAIITGVKPYVVEIATARYGNQTRDAEEGDSDLKRCHVCGDLTKTETVELEVCERHTTSDFGYNYPDHEMDAEAGSFRDGTGCISKGSFPSLTCEYCGFDPHALVYHQCKQNDEDLTWDEWQKELEFYFYEGSHSEQCQGLIDEMNAEDGTDESDICSHCGSVDDVHSCWSCNVSKCIECDDDEMRSDHDGHTYCDSCGPDSMDAEDYGVEAVWMADSYDPAIHGNTIPTGSVKRFLEKIPVGQMFHVDFVKSNGEVREMNAFFNKPYDTDSMTANVMERTGTGAVFKRFRVDRVVGLYRI